MNRNNNNYGNRNREAGVELRILLPSKVNLIYTQAYLIALFKKLSNKFSTTTLRIHKIYDVLYMCYHSFLICDNYSNYVYENFFCLFVIKRI